ncbi:MAG: stage 0 sporulation family protein [Candidatus Omnitrophica bacterium]|nr:stage 0 sporulation family protein [Candidatus Omnitrophota bacterium]MBU3933488.1 stage 0 sporulation family protein [Candidatus Omnitrophota bacterium]MBU4140548.1 stage 0 sporulation family protein [Candidatus Omnitrophota bacterium]
MQEVVLVRIREGKRLVYFSIKELPPRAGIRHIFHPGPRGAQAPHLEPAHLKKVKAGDYVIVEAEIGREYGQVISEAELVPETEIEAPLRRVIRIATREDLRQIQENKKKTKEAMGICAEKIAEHKLDMKLVDAEHSFDRSKFIFYFTAEGRVDFRELVKDLARQFRVRIELRQIGVRDEAKIFGGYGLCGRVLCCKSFLKDFEPVTVRMAKDQNLPLNPSKISGVCGRLMCCLGYEYQVYKSLLRGLPKQGETVNTKEGKGRVVSVNPLKRAVRVEVGEEGKQIELSYPLP